MSETFVRVGKVKDAHGIRGELYVVLFAGEADWLNKFKELRLVVEAGGADVKNYQIKSARVHKAGLIVKTNEIKDRNEAETLKGRLVEIPEAFLISKPGETIFLREILGFKVSTKARGEIGPVVKFSSNVAQDLLVVDTAHGQFEIPFVEAFIVKINYEAKTILMDLPEGLLGEEIGPELSKRDGQSDHLAEVDDGPESESEGQ